MAPIFLVTGPPAVGKTTLCQALLRRFSLGLHIPVDDLRQWVRTGLSDSVPWTEETERQFQIAEEAACCVARTYSGNGFAVAFDHCRNWARLEQMIGQHLEGLPVVRVSLSTDLETNLSRNRNRTNKDFQPELLVETIEYLNPQFGKAPPDGWLHIDNSTLEVEACVDRIMSNTASTME